MPLTESPRHGENCALGAPMFPQHDPLASPQYGNLCPCFRCLNLFRTMHGEIPALNALTEQAFRFRKEGRYAAHPVEAALQYHCAQAEKSGSQSHGGLDFESAEILYRTGTQGLRLSEIPELPQSIPELSRLSAVVRAALSGLRLHISLLKKFPFWELFSCQLRRSPRS